MPYYVAYNPSLGNALVGVSEHEMEAHGGDMPDLSKLLWNTATLMFDAKHVNIVTKREFIKRLTATEYATIKAAAMQSPELDYYWQMFMLADEISLEDVDTTRGVWMLELFGLIAHGRAMEILA